MGKFSFPRQLLRKIVFGLAVGCKISRVHRVHRGNIESVRRESRAPGNLFRAIMWLKKNCATTATTAPRIMLVCCCATYILCCGALATTLLLFLSAFRGGGAFFDQWWRGSLGNGMMDTANCPPNLSLIRHHLRSCSPPLLLLRSSEPSDSPFPSFLLTHVTSFKFGFEFCSDFISSASCSTSKKQHPGEQGMAS